MKTVKYTNKNGELVIKQYDNSKEKEYNKKYYDQHKTDLLEKVECVCGCKIAKNALKTHLLTKKHLSRLENK